MAVALPIFENFDIHADGNVSTRFDKWIKRLENLFIAADIDDTKRQRALLLHYGGQDLFDIFETLDGTGDDFETLKTKLTTHFEPKKNAEFEIYKFRQCKQNPGESIDEFHTRLRQMSKNCEFTDKDKEIKSQIIQCCSSSRLRRKALKTPKITLTNLLDEARSLEISEVQAQGIESTAINAVQSPKYRDKRVSTRVGERNGSTTVVKRDNKQCFRCGGQWPHNGTCPARNRKCVRCQRYGHFADFCDNFKKSQVKPKYGEPNRNRVNQVDTDQQLESETSSNSDDEYTFTVTNDSSVNSVNSRPELLVTINGKKQKMLIDSGSTANIVNENIAKILDVKVSKCTTNLYAFNAKDPLPVVGKFRAQIKYNGSVTKTDFVVIQGNGCNILGYNAACDLGVLKFVYTLDESKSKTEIIHSQYPKLFSGIGKMKDASVKLHISADIQPVKQTHRRIPFHQRKSVEECMDKLIQNDIIEPSQGATTWINPVVLVPKSSGGVRLCIDMREPNMAISRERHVMPTLDEIIHDLNGCAVYSKIDLKEGYHQLSLHPDSRHITTFSTHKGLYRYKRLSFGINAAAEKFQDVIASAISDIPNTKNISDDIICYGRSPEEHDKALHKLLQRCSDLNLTLNKAKCQFYMSEITFYGWVFSKGGLKPDPAKVKSIFNMKTPTNVSECRSLLGLTNYVSRCIPGYADIVKPIRELTKKDVAFLWSELQEHALNKLKSELVSSDVMAYFDPNKETELVVDASPYGLGGILSQGGRVIAYASKALSPTESKYSQIEREALSLSWGCHHFRMYLLGKHYTIKTDHMPLVTLFNNPKSKASSRIENWRLRLQNFHFTVHYGKGSENPADFMSRYVDNSVCNTSLVSESSEEYVNFVVSSSLPKAMSVDEIAEATKCDIVLQLVMGAISTNRWNMSQKDLDTYDAEVIKSFNGYGKMKDELTSVDGKLILRDHRIVVPKSLQDKIISLAHEGHQGMVKTKMLLRSKVWFPAMDSMCDSVVKQCFQCQVATNVKSREPLKMTELPKRPWDRVSADFAEVSGQYVLVVMDDYSRYPVVEIVHSTSAKAVIPKLDKIFSMFDIPKVLKTDNGPPFNGHEFENFAKHLGFKHRKVTPEWPEGNGEVERFMRTLKKFLHTSNNWKQEIQSFLRIYRGTAHLSTNVPPFNALFGRTMRGKFPDINAYSSVQEFDARTFEQYDRLRKARMKKDADERRNVKENDISVGDEVLVRQTKINKFSTPYSKFPMTVTSTNHSMVTAENDIKRMTRNSSFFKKIVPGTDIKNSGLIYDDASHESVEENLNTPSTHEANEPNETISARDSQKVVLRKSSRKVEKPSRLIEEI